MWEGAARGACDERRARAAGQLSQRVEPVGFDRALVRTPAAEPTEPSTGAAARVAMEALYEPHRERYEN